ncbi:MAG: TIR domain-containing protein [archaeon]|nr:TIR domain-containing protein [archaeon]
MIVFFSYSSLDQNSHRIQEIVDFLEYQDDIERVFYWERDTQGGETFDNYMRNSIKTSDIVIVFFTSNSNESIPVFLEIGIAKAFEKRIMPVFDEIKYVTAGINIRRGIQFSQDFRKFCIDLYFRLTGKQPKHQEIDAIHELRNNMSLNFKFDKRSYVEPQLKEIEYRKEIYSDINFQNKDLKYFDTEIPFIDFRIFKFIFFDYINRGKVNIITGPMGSGKSSLLQCLKYDILNENLLQKYIPVYINIKRVNNVETQDLLTLFYNNFLPNTENRYFTNFKSTVENGKIIFLLDSISELPNPVSFLNKIKNFIKKYNALILLTFRDTIFDYIHEIQFDEKDLKIYRLNIFKETSLFEWVVLNKNNYEQTRKHTAEEIYLVIKKIVKEKEQNEEEVILSLLMQDYLDLKLK